MTSSGNSASPAKLPVSGDNKGSSGTGGDGGPKTEHLKPPEQGLKCPRCDSPNTKFCYYNNYSLTQPRHYCKTCRRYWTKGGALRNVPIGGDTRRNKKMKSNSSSVSGLDSKNSTLSSSETSGFEIYHRISPAAMEFQLGGLIPHFPGLHSSSIPGSFDQLASATAANPSCLESSVRPSSLMGTFNHPVSSAISGGFNGRIQEVGGSLMNFNSTGFASPIESLSCINQDMHLKLQHQRLGSSVMFGAEGNDQKESSTVSTCLPGGAILEEDQITSSKPQPISFQNLEILKPVPNCGVISHPIRTTDWFFEINSCTPTTTSTTTASTNYNRKVDGNTRNWSNGVQSWNGLNQFSSLP